MNLTIKGFIMDYFLFMTICIIATATPGPAVFLALKNGASYGFRKSLIAIMGNVLAMITMAAISALGLGTLILTSSTLFFIIKIVGGIYLIYLGVKTFRSSSLYKQSQEKLLNKSSKALFKEAFFVGISNPKAIAFYTALFPQFLNLEKGVFLQFVFLTLTFAFFSFFFLSFYAFLSTKIKIYLAKQKVAKWFNRVLGSFFVIFGISIAASNK